MFGIEMTAEENKQKPIYLNELVFRKYVGRKEKQFLTRCHKAICIEMGNDLRPKTKKYFSFWKSES